MTVELNPSTLPIAHRLTSLLKRAGVSFSVRLDHNPHRWPEYRYYLYPTPSAPLGTSWNLLAAEDEEAAEAEILQMLAQGSFS